MTCQFIRRIPAYSNFVELCQLTHLTSSIDTFDFVKRHIRLDRMSEVKRFKSHNLGVHNFFFRLQGESKRNEWVKILEIRTKTEIEEMMVYGYRNKKYVSPVILRKVENLVSQQNANWRPFFFFICIYTPIIYYISTLFRSRKYSFPR